MKELRPRGGNIRILFAFDPRRMGIMLLAGDKTGKWNKWYTANIPRADERFDEYLESSERDDVKPTFHNLRSENDGYSQ